MEVMNDMRTRFNTRNLPNQLGVLVAHDYEVVEFSENHYRINGELDVWPTTKRAYNIKTHQRFNFRFSDVATFVLTALPHTCGKTT